jgi:hypothetical protein
VLTDNDAARGLRVGSRKAAFRSRRGTSKCDRPTCRPCGDCSDPSEATADGSTRRSGVAETADESTSAGQPVSAQLAEDPRARKPGAGSRTQRAVARSGTDAWLRSGARAVASFISSDRGMTHPCVKTPFDGCVGPGTRRLAAQRVAP